jgi:hypothetical protein
MMGEKLGIFLSHPGFHDLPALLETPGSDGHGPDAGQVESLRELCRRWANTGAGRTKNAPQDGNRGHRTAHRRSAQTADNWSTE